jgi:hypothetical protein
MAVFFAVPIFTASLGCAQVPGLSSGVGRDSDITTLPSGAINVVFHVAQWPNVQWTATTPWNWAATQMLAVTVTNPGKATEDVSIRVDDDTSADGTRNCRTGSAPIAAGETAILSLDLSGRADTRSVYGMVGAPPNPAASTMHAMSAGGSVDLSHIVAFQIFLHSPETPVELVIKKIALLPADSYDDRYIAIVDEFGQFTRADWPGKLHSAANFAARRDQEAAELSAAPSLPGLDQYGGWAKGPALKATGYYYTTNRDGKWWLVTPAGHLFLSFGFDGVGAGAQTIVDGREKMFTWLPTADDPLYDHFGYERSALYGPVKSGKTFDFFSANLQRKFGTNYLTEWRKESIARIRSWGFNTIGNWSDADLEGMDKLPYTATLGVSGNHAHVPSGSDYWGEMSDPFDPQFAVDADNGFKSKAAAIRNDPWCIGYFVDNELSWGGKGPDGGRYGLAYGALSLASSSPAKQAFLAQLKASYATISAFNSAWNTAIASWADLDAPYKASLTPSDAQKHDMSTFVSAYALKYFTVVSNTLKKYDPNHLYLGCRFAWRTQEAVDAAAKICDVVSFNVYAKKLNPQQWAFAAALNKPCIIGEFHVGSLDRGMFHTGLVSASSEDDRAAVFSGYVSSVIDNPSFVGAHWFEYHDEPLTGRSLDGENYNIGFVSVTDTPYPEMVAAARRVFGEAYARRLDSK